jgi:DNA-binding MarR family transcriptional regulator
MAPKTSLLYDTFVLYQSVGTMLGRALTDAPLAPEEYAIYSHIFEYDGCTPSEMARSLNMPMQTVSDWVALLRDRGHLVSVINDRDRRSFRMSLTDAGRQAQRDTHVYFERVNRLFIKGLPRPEREMRAYVREIIEATQSATMTIERKRLQETG